MKDKNTVNVFILLFYTATSNFKVLYFFFQNDQSMQDMQIMGGDDLSKLTGKVC